jgi:hypothetical protein
MKELLVALVLAHGADSASTLAALRAGAREANPLLSQRAVVNTLERSAIVAAQLVGLTRLARHKPRLARRLALVAIGLESGLAGYNVSVTIAARRP